MDDTLRFEERRSTWPAYAAAVWAIAFGCLSFYWAAGGHVGLETVAQAIREKVLAHDHDFMLVVWVTGALKVALGVLCLALVRQWRVGVPHRLVRAAAWISGGALSLYGAMGIANGALAELGVFEPQDATGVRWYLFLWGPVWLTGGLLILTAAWRSKPRARPRESRAPRSGDPRRFTVAAVVAALATGSVGLLVGGGWGILILEAGTAVVVVAVLALHPRREGDGDAAG